ncbi:hypothetical protein [Streptomyces endophyticus]|uniref:Uncharacterized protein n=1 Tax=Streptomyces endophyticus TaxID=714166 RepID=A0ABU6FH48_9ACTN|nr:hypothetical protein [Streptomyces endophyticus]MEB8342117.1 hypothetical protein [Streptomyces endophyticus]
MAGQRVTPLDVFGTTGVTDKLRPQYTQLLDGLDAMLDLESGLREILLHADHEQQTAELDGHLDVTGGLAAILPAAPAPTSRPSWDRRGTEHRGVDLLEVEPAVRMQLRQDPQVIEFRESLEAAEDMTQQIEGVSDLASKLVSQLTEAEGDIEFSDIMETTLHLARAARSLTTLPNRNVETAIKQVDFSSMELTVSCNTASDAARTLATVRYTRRRSWYTPEQLPLREAQRLLAAAVEKALASAYSLLDRCVAARGAVAQFQLWQAIQIRQRLNFQLAVRGVPRLTASDLRDFLNDFISADLRGADLAGVDMTGVRWSVQTLWPVDLDLDDLRQRSVEEPLGSGIYVVRSGTARTRQLEAV